MLNQTSPTPSPSRGRRMNASPSQSFGGLGLGIQGPSDEEDEETLQLKLQEIQAKLRLKKLQSAKANQSSPGSSTLTGAGTDAALMSPGTRTSIKSPVQHRQNPIEVPASPVRKMQAHQQQTSPSRVLLGIDKGWTAKDVSLKRAPSHKRLNSIRKIQRGEYKGLRKHNITAKRNSPSRQQNPQSVLNQSIATMSIAITRAINRFSSRGTKRKNGQEQSRLRVGSQSSLHSLLVALTQVILVKEWMKRMDTLKKVVEILICCCAVNFRKRHVGRYIKGHRARSAVFDFKQKLLWHVPNQTFHLRQRK